MLTDAIVLPPATVDAIQPAVREITWSDLFDSLREGVADFSAKPSHMVFVAIIYPIVGILIASVAMRDDLLPLLFPFAAGFALVGPFAALGLYEVSRRRDLGLDPSWRDAIGVFRSPAIAEIGKVGLLLMVIFVAWLGVAKLVYDLTLGPASPTSISQFAHDVLATPAGWALIVVGNALGCVFAGVALSVGIVSVPMLVDRDVGFATAVSTSARCVARNPVKLTAWGFIVAMSLFAGSLPVFVGLALVLPILGHASWHLYRKLVAASS